MISELIIDQTMTDTHYKGQGADDCPSLAVLVCKDTGQGETNHLADTGAISETCLPGCGELITPVRSEVTILLREGREGKETEDNLAAMSFVLKHNRSRLTAKS